MYNKSQKVNNNYSNNPVNNYKSEPVLREVYSRNMMSAQNYMNSSNSTVPCGTLHTPQYVQNQYFDPALALQPSVQQMLNLVNYNMSMNYNMSNMQMSPNMSMASNIPATQSMPVSPIMSATQNAPLDSNVAVNQSFSRSSLSPPRSVSQAPLMSPTPTFVDMYGNQMVPVYISSYSPPNNAQYIPVSPMIVPTVYPSPSTTQSVSPEMFVSTENFDVSRSRRGSVEPRSRRNSLEAVIPTAVPVENKKELVPRVLKELQAVFAERFTQTGLRGKDIFRVKCKTKPSLKNILELLQFMDGHISLKEVSCPASTKKGKRQKRGFLCYVKVELEDMPMAERLFEAFNSNRGQPFNSIEVDPQRKTKVCV